MADDEWLIQTAEAIGASVLLIDRLPETALRVFNVTTSLRHV